MRVPLEFVSLGRDPGQRPASTIFRSGNEQKNLDYSGETDGKTNKRRNENVIVAVRPDTMIVAR